MRQIRKQPPPPALTEWVAANKGGPNCSYGSIGGDLRALIRAALIAEQGNLCAYTGRAIGAETCHIEHLKPQAHCGDREDVAYGNLVAAVPMPNAPKLPYGAHLKDNWPSEDQAVLFVSPLQDGCTARFSYNFRGEIRSSNPDDQAAIETIRRLGLDHGILVAFRRKAIDMTLRAPKKGPASLDAKSAKRRLKGLQDRELVNGQLEQFSFVLIHALEKHIARIQKITAKKRLA